MTHRPKPTVARPHRLDARLHRLFHRAKGERGASLVEYSLIFALVLVASVGATKYLSSQGSSQVANQANCISTRPPPTNCIQGVPSTATSTTGVGPTTSTTFVSTTTTTAATTTTGPNVVVGAPSGGTYDHGTGNVSGTTVTITPSSGSMTSGTVQFKVSQKNNGTPVSTQYIQVTCTVAGNNLSCVLPSTTMQYTWQTGVTVEVSVTSSTTTPSTTSMTSGTVTYS